MVQPDVPKWHDPDSRIQGQQYCNQGVLQRGDRGADFQILRSSNSLTIGSLPCNTTDPGV